MHWLFAAAAAAAARHPRHEPPQRRLHPRPQPRARYPLVDDKLRMRRPVPRIGVPTPAVYRRRRSALAAPPAGRPARRPRRLRRQTEPRLRRPRRPRAHRPRRRRLPAAQRRAARPEQSAATRLRHPLRHVLARRPTGRGHVPAARPAAPGVRGRSPTRASPTSASSSTASEPAMAMLRLPTQGLRRPGQPAPGRHRHRRRSATRPDQSRRAAQPLRADCTRTPGPPWSAWRCRTGTDVLDMARRVAEAVGLGYLGVDIVVDAHDGPLLAGGQRPPRAGHPDRQRAGPVAAAAGDRRTARRESGTRHGGSPAPPEPAAHLSQFCQDYRIFLSAGPPGPPRMPTLPPRCGVEFAESRTRSVPCGRGLAFVALSAVFASEAGGRGRARGRPFARPARHTPAPAGDPPGAADPAGDRPPSTPPPMPAGPGEPRRRSPRSPTPPAGAAIAGLVRRRLHPVHDGRPAVGQLRPGR